MSTATVVIQRPNTLQDAYTRTLITMSYITCHLYGTIYTLNWMVVTIT
jgi:hypothetical protein